MTCRGVPIEKVNSNIVEEDLPAKIPTSSEDNIESCAPKQVVHSNDAKAKDVLPAASEISVSADKSPSDSILIGYERTFRRGSLIGRERVVSRRRSQTIPESEEMFLDMNHNSFASELSIDDPFGTIYYESFGTAISGQDETEGNPRERSTPRRGSRASIKGMTIDADLVLQEITELDENPSNNDSSNTFSTDGSINSALFREFQGACGRDSIVIARERNIPRNSKAREVEGKLSDYASTSTISTDVSLDSALIREFQGACGRDSKVVARERNMKSRSRASESDGRLSNHTSTSTLSTDVSLDSALIREFQSVCGRDSHSVTRERLCTTNLNQENKQVYHRCESHVA